MNIWQPSVLQIQIIKELAKTIKMFISFTFLDMYSYVHTMHAVQSYSYYVYYKQFTIDEIQSIISTYFLTLAAL